MGWGGVINFFVTYPGWGGGGRKKYQAETGRVVKIFGDSNDNVPHSST